MSTIVQNFSNFFDAVVTFLSVIYDTLVSVTTGAVDLFRMAFTYVSYASTGFSSIFLPPITISCAFVVVVGVIKLIVGRDT